MTEDSHQDLVGSITSQSNYWRDSARVAEIERKSSYWNPGRYVDLRSGVDDLRSIANNIVLTGADIIGAPDALLKRARNAFRDVEHPYKEIVTFDPQKFSAERGLTIGSYSSQLTDAFTAMVDQAIPAIVPLVTYMAATFRLTDAGRGEEEVDRIIARTNDQAGVAIQAIAKRQEEADDLLRATQEIARKVGIAQYAQLFETEANSHKKSAYGWLAATAVFGLVVLGFCLWNLSLAYQLVPAGVQTPNVPQLILAKVIVFSFAVSIPVWCARIYRAHRHNVVVNRHRQNSLSSFETFVRSTNDEATKNAVLIQATQSIFAQQPSGYSTLEPETAGAPQILEVLRQPSK